MESRGSREHEPNASITFRTACKLGFIYPYAEPDDWTVWEECLGLTKSCEYVFHSVDIALVWLLW
jgi:hypothetical protein